MRAAWALAATARASEPFASEAAASTPGTAPSSAGSNTRRTIAFILGGAGIVGIGLGSVFGLLASSSFSSQKSDCASSTDCANHGQALADHDATVTYGTISTVGFIAGGALLAGGAVLFFTSPAPPRSAVLVAPSVGRSSGGLSLKGSF